MKKKYLILAIIALLISICYLSKDNLLFGTGFILLSGLAYFAAVNPIKITSKK